ncbi:Scr1 family TA system antitoxin-like transcriptional regulator [Plantactinospora sp. KLBMP9567]|uniref:Scr1 family TA system antitoxin-like transcriptional regulator n=1 Tax=Plantactinospora sp. KLBMP9567 TaxID=3085900 RepID=UPI003990461D
MTQEILCRRPDPCQLVAVIDEGVLHRRVGDAEVMRDQFVGVIRIHKQRPLTALEFEPWYRTPERGPF